MTIEYGKLTEREFLFISRRIEFLTEGVYMEDVFPTIFIPLVKKNAVKVVDDGWGYGHYVLIEDHPEVSTILKSELL